MVIENSGDHWSVTDHWENDNQWLVIGKNFDQWLVVRNNVDQWLVIWNILQAQLYQALNLNDESSKPALLTHITKPQLSLAGELYQVQDANICTKTLICYYKSHLSQNRSLKIIKLCKKIVKLGTMQHIVLNRNNGCPVPFFSRYQEVLVNIALAVSVECDLSRLRLVAQIDDVSCQILAQCGWITLVLGHLALHKQSIVLVPE